ncbi:hypothetical protein BC835DRAFT_1413773 [Cytidiella melzeri]|nr:hypothetical protein BC835DRAFT_1413773 [Cytidiella melzeri]
MSNHSQKFLFDEALQDALAIRRLNTAIRGPLVVDTTLWGAFTLLIIVSSALWIRAAPHSKRRAFVIATCVIMHIMATAHWAVVLHWLDKTPSSAEQALVSCLQYALNGGATTCVPSLGDPDVLARSAKLSLPPTFPLTAMLAVNIALSDVAVLLRPISIWWYRWNFGSCATWVVNVWATSVVGYKAWEHKRVIGTYLTQGHTRTLSERIFTLFLVPGCFYCALRVSTHPQKGHTDTVFGTLGSTRLANTVSTYLTDAALIQMIGIYSTISATLAVLEKMQLKVGGPLAAYAVRTITPGPLSPLHLRLPVHRIEVNVQAAADCAARPMERALNASLVVDAEEYRLDSQRMVLQIIDGESITQPLQA